MASLSKGLLAGAKLREARTLPNVYAKDSQIHRLKIALIDPDSAQPRTTFDEAKLEELGDTIQAQGQQQPIKVRFNDGRYTIVFGERRYLAMKLKGFTEIDAIIHEGEVDSKSILLMQMTENISREDMTEYETARGYQRLISEFGLSAADVCRLVGVSKSAMSTALKVLNNANGKVLDLVENGTATFEKASTLMDIQNLAPDLAHSIIDEAKKTGVLERQVLRSVKQTLDKAKKLGHNTDIKPTLNPLSRPRTKKQLQPGLRVEVMVKKSSPEAKRFYENQQTDVLSNRLPAYLSHTTSDREGYCWVRFNDELELEFKCSDLNILKVYHDEQN